MPRVGNRQFAYTPEGLAQARAESGRTGQKVIYETDTAALIGDDLEKEAMGRRGNRNNTGMTPRERNRRQRPTRGKRY